MGLLGMDTIARERTWPDDAENLLKIIGEILVSAQERERAGRVGDQAHEHGQDDEARPLRSQVEGKEPV